MVEVANLKIEEGVQNWSREGITSGEIEVTLPNGTIIQIQSSVSGNWNSCNIAIHYLKNTEVVIFNNSKLTKKQKKVMGTKWTVIKEE